jgi:hypothetical protein
MFCWCTLPNRGYTQTAAEIGIEKMSKIYLEGFTHWRDLKGFLEKDI